MNPDLLRNYLENHQPSRRGALRLAGAAGVAGAVAAAASPALAAPPRASAGTRTHRADFTDEPFDYADPHNLSDWAPSRYGADDQRGSFNEVTPEVTAAALGLVRGARAVQTYNMGELMFNGFPAYDTDPRRTYEQRLMLAGYEPPPSFLEQGGILASTEPLGDNRLSIHEERFEAEMSPRHPKPLATTYQIASQIDGLNHIGADDYLYNGFRGREIIAGHGTTRLGNEHMGPIATRGVLLDIVGTKLEQGKTADLTETATGAPLLVENYRITVEDIEDALDFGGIGTLLPGDVVIVRTGWSQLLAQRDAADISRWKGKHGLPGIYLREARWLSQFRPAIIGSDTWAFEVVGNRVNNDGTAFPVHQELMMRHGIRIGESFVTDGLAHDGVHEFLFVITPQYAEGATAGNTPPVALAPRRNR